MLESRAKDTHIHGANWEAPANSRFSRAELDFAVRKIVGASNAWVDVFCIPQSNDVPGKAIEIRKAERNL